MYFKFKNMQRKIMLYLLTVEDTSVLVMKTQHEKIEPASLHILKLVCH
jgi:hypothetical protein